MDKIEQKYLQAVELIKKAILQSQYNAIRLANQEQLKLYFGIGRYISENSRNGFWSTGALDFISAQLKNSTFASDSQVTERAHWPPCEGG